MEAIRPIIMQPAASVLPDKSAIVSYMKTRPKTAIAPKFFRDPLTDKPIAEIDWREDSEYGWSSETTYLFEVHNYPLPDRFVEHVRAMLH